LLADRKVVPVAHDITAAPSPQRLAVCPDCREPAVRYLADTSRNAYVDYFRCTECGHVYNVPKGAPDAPHVTVATGRRASA